MESRSKMIEECRSLLAPSLQLLQPNNKWTSQLGRRGLGALKGSTRRGSAWARPYLKEVTQRPTSRSRLTTRAPSTQQAIPKSQPLRNIRARKVETRCLVRVKEVKTPHVVITTRELLTSTAATLSWSMIRLKVDFSKNLWLQGRTWLVDRLRQEAIYNTLRTPSLHMTQTSFQVNQRQLTIAPCSSRSSRCSARRRLRPPLSNNKTTRLRSTPSVCRRNKENAA